MKITCHNCRKALRVPEKLGGRKVKCPACKQPVKVPQAGDPPSEEDMTVDLGSLSSIEAAGEVLIFERKSTKPLTLKEAQAVASTGGSGSDKIDLTLRTCPQCNTKVKVEDLYTEVMCRHCGSGIPPIEVKRAELVGYKAKNTAEKFQVSFYAGFGSAAFYPLPAIGGILAGAGIALAVIALPVSGVVGLQSASSLNEASETQADLGWVGYFITVMFVLEAIYFGSVAYYALIDTVRTTTSGTDLPPRLTWSPTKLGVAMGGYGALIGAYALIVLILLAVSGASIPPGAEDLEVLVRPASLVVLALLTFSVPMCMIGLSSSEAMDGLNPKKTGLSIVHVIGHYFFLFLIFVLYLGAYVGLMYGVMTLAGPAIMEAAREGITKGYVSMLLGLAGWAGVMGLGFYFAYSIGRILGLFARTFKKKLEFEL